MSDATGEEVVDLLARILDREVGLIRNSSTVGRQPWRWPLHLADPRKALLAYLRRDYNYTLDYGQRFATPDGTFNPRHQATSAQRREAVDRVLAALILEDA